MDATASTNQSAYFIFYQNIDTCRYAVGKSKVFKKQVPEMQVVMCEDLSSLMRTVDWKEREGTKENLLQKDAFDMIYY